MRWRHKSSSIVISSLFSTRSGIGQITYGCTLCLQRYLKTVQNVQSLFQEMILFNKNHIHANMSISLQIQTHEYSHIFVFPAILNCYLDYLIPMVISFAWLKCLLRSKHIIAFNPQCILSIFIFEDLLLVLSEFFE